MAIKAAARKPWAADDHFATTWYEPWPDPSAGITFTLSVPGVHAFCTPGDLHLLRASIDAADRFMPLDDDAWNAAISDAAELPSIFPLGAA
jgi:hypothetical protein